MNGHRAKHGSTMVLLFLGFANKGIGIYGSLTAGLPLSQFNFGSRRLICMRALPGKVSDCQISTPAGPIGENECDSYASGGTYVIRRACQTLPCFVVHF